VIERNLVEGRLTNPSIRCVGLSVNTEHLDESVARALLEKTAAAHALPCVDPIRFGVAPIVDALERHYHA
jgi:uncharacterized NAD-dependent epimerase/dehydratase family protein